MDWEEWYSEIQRIGKEDFGFHDRIMWGFGYAKKRWRRYYEEGYKPREAIREDRCDLCWGEEKKKPSMEQLRDEVKG